MKIIELIQKKYGYIFEKEDKVCNEITNEKNAVTQAIQSMIEKEKIKTKQIKQMFGNGKVNYAYLKYDYYVSSLFANYELYRNSINNLMENISPALREYLKSEVEMLLKIISNQIDEFNQIFENNIQYKKQYISKGLLFKLKDIKKYYSDIKELTEEYKDENMSAIETYECINEKRVEDGLYLLPTLPTSAEHDIETIIIKHEKMFSNMMKTIPYNQIWIDDELLFNIVCDIDSNINKLFGYYCTYMELANLSDVALECDQTFIISEKLINETTDKISEEILKVVYDEFTKDSIANWSKNGFNFTVNGTKYYGIIHCVQERSKYKIEVLLHTYDIPFSKRYDIDNKITLDPLITSIKIEKKNNNYVLTNYKTNAVKKYEENEHNYLFRLINIIAKYYEAFEEYNESNEEEMEISMDLLNDFNNVVDRLKTIDDKIVNEHFNNEMEIIYLPIERIKDKGKIKITDILSSI